MGAYLIKIYLMIEHKCFYEKFMLIFMLIFMFMFMFMFMFIQNPLFMKNNM